MAVSRNVDRDPVRLEPSCHNLCHHMCTTVGLCENRITLGSSLALPPYLPAAQKVSQITQTGLFQ